tara:strand:+ start:195 stop:854 length:660 start_codon:yes stop_codon:yes gene_type:complete
VNKFLLYLLILFQIFPLLGCQRINDETLEIDNKSYINDFELSQKNPMNDTLIIIKSPKAIIDPTNNDIEIFDNSIKIINKNGKDVQVKSGNSTLNNSSNLIRVFNKVNISLLENQNYFVTTDSFIWDLNSSNINLNRPLNINFDNTRISSLSGSYNINTSILILNKNIFNRNIFNTEGKEQYQIETISDIASWFKKENIFEFTSNNKQVETTINFLSIK